MAIPAQFQTALPFSAGLAAVSLGGRYGYIDKSGKIVINPQFEQASNFYEGLASVRMGNRWGYVDKNGKIVMIRNSIRRASSPTVWH